MRSVRTTPVLALALALAPLGAHAWESKCYQYPDPTLDTAALRAQRASECSPDAGPNAARQRWIGENDEHRQIWELTAHLAGLPESLSQTTRLRVFTSQERVNIGNNQLIPSLVPQPFAQSTRVQTRAFTVGELTQLPDFSYGLWDWAEGNETCPLDGLRVTAAECHGFATHMGPVNANHFVPQSREFYRRLHATAIARAQQCAQTALAIGQAPDRARFADYVLSCETEALAIEAVAQHYLQDAWSMGHMWQRWGSPNLADMPGASREEQRVRALLVAMAAGLMHGARGLLQALPGWTSYDVDDPLCAPNEQSFFVSNGRLSQGIGDLYLSTMVPAPGVAPPDPRFAVQYDHMVSCGAAGMLAVYRAAGMNHGALGANAPFANTTLDPLADECWGQRATNLAMLLGAGIHWKVLGHQNFLEMDARFVSWALPTVGATSGSAAVDQRLRNAYRLDLQRAVSVLRILAKQNPTGTEAAEGGIGDILGIRPNGAYAQRDPIASYVDPALPWPRTRDTVPDASTRATALARMFHRAHVADWCAATTAQDLSALRAHAMDPALDAEAHAAACEACEEIAVRHLRVGEERHYDATHEPVCRYLTERPAYVYQHGQIGGDANALARAWCGCDARPAVYVPVAPVVPAPQ